MLSSLLRLVSGCWDDLIAPNIVEPHFHLVAAAVAVVVIVGILLVTKILRGGGGRRRCYDQDVVLITGGLPPFFLFVSKMAVHSHPRWTTGSLGIGRVLVEEFVKRKARQVVVLDVCKPQNLPQGS